MEKKPTVFGETFKDEAEDRALLENLRRAEVGCDMQNCPGTGNTTSSEPPADLFHRMSGPRNPISFDMGLEGGQNAVRSLENVHQSADYIFSQRTSNKRNLSNTNDSLTRCNIRNKKVRYCEMNPNESSCQPLHLSNTGASYKTDGISGGENSSCQKTQSSTSASSKECSNSALSSSKNSKDQGKKHVCDVCRKEYASVSGLNRHKRIHNAENPLVCNTCKGPFPNPGVSKFTSLLTPVRNRTPAKFANENLLNCPISILTRLFTPEQNRIIVTIAVLKLPIKVR
ncbi:hypothetical protein CEXT_265991 [Caerostris extrusa]|uniref:C2H2-type domain-containing protein n=1 Tax=Caerostris extrusa TaxID=172846 RepID=A0AAV4TW22_CAEEX|nr:hypothetical protein CEXT_265991 [Caerostris extrusa]